MRTLQPPIVTRHVPTRKNALEGDNVENNTASFPSQRTKVVEFTFILDHAESGEVFLCGDFNQWAPQSLRMIRRDCSGRWEKRLTLLPGRYEYKFIVDGQWISDPLGSAEVPNPYGSSNSVVEVRL
jgi:1,4-alpha-glucan branching enzyme